jgi:hypothetical protein
MAMRVVVGRDMFHDAQQWLLFSQCGRREKCEWRMDLCMHDYL